MIVQKLFANRAQDISDVESIADWMRAMIDWKYVLTQLGPLGELKQDPTVVLA